MRRARHPQAVRDAIHERSKGARSYYEPRVSYLVVIHMRDGKKEWFSGGTTLASARERVRLAFDEDHEDLVDHAWIRERRRP